MSFWDRLFGFGKEVILLSAKTEELSRNVESLSSKTSDIDKRLVRIETIIEVAKYQAAEKQKQENLDKEQNKRVQRD